LALFYRREMPFVVIFNISGQLWESSITAGRRIILSLFLKKPGRRTQ
jgi:hypothetical protein